METKHHISRSKLWWAGLILLVITYIAAGVNHFINTEFYMKLMPPIIPYHLFMVYASGVVEIVLGLLLLVPKLRIIAAWGIILLLIAVFPANIYHAITEGVTTNTPAIATYIRLPFQALFLWWAWVYTK
ncbi:MAG: DoxX family protein [Chitinophagales bacterium]|nr:DoxX family protein [Chitinophagales bacterium]